MLERDEIDNAIGVIALQWLALHRDEVRASAGVRRDCLGPLPVYGPAEGSAGSSRASTSWTSGRVSSIASATRR